MLASLAGAGGCFEDSTGVDSGVDSGAAEGSSGERGTTGSGGSDVEPVTTSATITTGVDATGPQTSTTSDDPTGDPPPAACGDGVVAPGELCWGAPVTVDGGGAAHSMQAAEFDGDGWLDLVIAVPTEATLLLGDGAGGFVAQPPIMTVPGGTGGGSTLIATLDVGDTVDLVATNGGTYVTGVLGDGQGGFAAPVATMVPGVNPEGLLVGDYTNDGVTDVLVFRTSGYDVFFGVGQGNGAFSFANELSVTEPGPRVAGDFDGDGNLDAVIGQGLAQTLTWLRGTGTAAMTPSDVPFGLAFGFGRPAGGDLDDDGTDDAVFPLGDEDQVAVVLGAVGIGPTAPLLLDTTGEPAATAVADVDADGTLDVVSCGRGLFAALSVWRGDGAGGFAPVEELSITPCEHLAIGDFDGDGALDAAYHTGGSNGLRVVLAEP